ncbi:hypothetical protein [Streptomyces sp. NPDC006996]
MGATRNANAVIAVREAGLDRFRFDGLMGAVGMRRRAWASSGVGWLVGP